MGFDRYDCASRNLASDRFQAMKAKKREGDIRQRVKQYKKWVEFFRVHPIPTKMNLKDWAETHPGFPQTLRYAKSVRTFLRRHGMI